MFYIKDHLPDKQQVVLRVNWSYKYRDPSTVNFVVGT